MHILYSYNLAKHANLLYIMIHSILNNTHGHCITEVEWAKNVTNNNLNFHNGNLKEMGLSS